MNNVVVIFYTCISLFQALSQWGPDSARPAPAFSIVPTDREPGTRLYMYIQQNLQITILWIGSDVAEFMSLIFY